MNHGITNVANNKCSTGSPFMDRLIFPNAELTSLSLISDYMEKAEYEILDVESLRKHYMMTLQLWTENLRNHEREAVGLVGEKIYRTWLLYLAGCSYAFEKGEISVYQVLLSKRQKGFPSVPLTRADLYDFDASWIWNKSGIPPMRVVHFPSFACSSNLSSQKPALQNSRQQETSMPELPREWS